MATSGSLGSTPLTVLVRERCMGKETARIILNENESIGEVCIVDGQVIHAQHDNVSGPEAFYDMTDWRCGTFTIEPDSLAETRTIELPWTQLLIEGAKRAYASGFDAAAYPEPDEPEILDSEFQEELPDHEIDLDSLLEIRGVIGAIAVAPDGVPVRAELGKGNVESASALVALVGGAGDQIAEILSLGAFEQAFLSFGAQRMIVLKDNDLYLGLGMNDQASAALVSRNARQILNG